MKKSVCSLLVSRVWMVPSIEEQARSEFLMARHHETLAPVHPAKRDVSGSFKRLPLLISFSQHHAGPLVWW